MVGSINFYELFETVSKVGNTENGLILIVLFVIISLVLGIPAVLKKSFKGVILAIFCTTFATVGTYFLLF